MCHGKPCRCMLSQPRCLSLFLIIAFPVITNLPRPSFYCPAVSELFLALLVSPCSSAVSVCLCHTPLGFLTKELLRPSSPSYPLSGIHCVVRLISDGEQFFCPASKCWNCRHLTPCLDSPNLLQFKHHLVQWVIWVRSGGALLQF